MGTVESFISFAVHWRRGWNYKLWNGKYDEKGLSCSDSLAKEVEYYWISQLI